jgi:threonine dehydrogenase-like Zn-dependent dehydrogenase
MQAAVEMLADNPGILDFAITHRFPFSQSKAAFDLVDSYSDGVIKAVIHS